MKQKQQGQLEKILSVKMSEIASSAQSSNRKSSRGIITRNPSAQQLKTAREVVQQKLELDGVPKNIYQMPPLVIIEPLKRFKLVKKLHGSQMNLH